MSRMDGMVSRNCNRPLASEAHFRNDEVSKERAPCPKRRVYLADCPIVRALLSHHCMFGGTTISLSVLSVNYRYCGSHSMSSRRSYFRQPRSGKENIHAVNQDRCWKLDEDRRAFHVHTTIVCLVSNLGYSTA